MKTLLTAATTVAALMACSPALAQARPTAAQAQTPAVQPVQPLSDRASQTTYADPSAEPDVLLDVPNLSVEEITIEVDNLRAKIALEARLANLLSLSAGADVGIDKVKVSIKGVQAQVLLKVRLDNVAQIIDRTLTTIDRNPEILEGLLSTVDNTVDTVGGVANTTLQPGGVVDNTVGTVGGLAGSVTRR